MTAVIGLVYSLTAVITTEPGTERTASVMAGLWMFGIATFASIGLLAFAELIRVFLDIELNTRKE